MTHQPEQVRDLQRLLRELKRIIVAYSGGVDSAVLLAVAVQELGDNVLAVTGRSESLAQGELESASEVARLLGARHEVIETAEFDDPSYRANPKNRCFYCKHELFSQLQQIAHERGFAQVVDGFNADDGTSTLDVRPGHEAGVALGVRSPLAEAGLGKTAIRALAQTFGLPVWNKPATPCLSSRVPYGTAIEVDDLRRIDLAERYLRALGYEVVRVRHFGATARIEVPATQVPRLVASRSSVSRALRSVGYEHVEIDSRGYRTGSLNE